MKKWPEITWGLYDLSQHSFGFAKMSTGPKVLVCKPCAEARSIREDMLVKNAIFGGMNDLHQDVSRPDAKFISF